MKRNLRDLKTVYFFSWPAPEMELARSDTGQRAVSQVCQRILTTSCLAGSVKGTGGHVLSLLEVGLLTRG